MASFHIWNPAFVGSDRLVVECHVTQGHAIQLARGTPQLIRDVLEVLGVEAAPVGWAFDAMRTHYYSAYRRSSSDWGDAWDLAWRLRAELPETAALTDVPERGYLDLETVDASYRNDDRPSLWPAWPCLVLADFEDPISASQARGLVRARFPRAVISAGIGFGVLPQLRCDLGPQPRAFYESGAGAAEELLQELVAAGASVHQQDSLRWLQGRGDGPRLA
jgi:hypothetical protein